MAELPKAPLSISDAVDSGFDSKPDTGADDGSGAKDGAAPADDGGDEGNEGDDPDGSDGKPDDGKPPADDKGKEPKVDPENGAYQGEYTEERFSGLMKQWQDDLRGKREAEAKLAELQKNPPAAAPPKPENTDEIEIPPELADADDDAKQGYRILMKNVMKQTDKIKEAVLAQVLDKMQEPVRQEQENVTKIKREVTDLSAEFGKGFSERQKDVIAFADKHGYPVGTLRQAYLAFAEIESAKRGRKTTDEIKNDKDKEEEIPGPGKGRMKVSPRFDPDRDGKKSISELYDEAVR